MARFAYTSAVFLFLLFSPAFALGALGCNPGATECVDNTSFRTCTDFALWGEPVSCLAGQQCVNGACEMKLGCSPGARECIDSSSYHVCNSYALWDPAVSCASWQSCSAGSCTPPVQQCTQYQQTRCDPNNQNKVQICDAQYQWSPFRDCDYGCSSGYCISCRPGMTRCADSYSYQTCDGSGSWGSTSRCGQNYVCSQGSCEISPLLKCGNVGDMRCAPDGSPVLQRCGPNYQWADYTACQFGCSSGACKVCIYGDKKCKDSQAYLNCGVGGQWGGETSCPTGYFCFGGSCQVPNGNQCSAPGAKRCSPSNPQMVQACSNNYVYSDYLQCNDGCINGVCAECTPGTSVCSGAATYRTCTSYGQLTAEQSCGSGYTCDNGQCIATPACSEGQRNCVSDAIYACTSGQWHLLYYCPPDKDCKESSGTAYCADESRSAGNQSVAPAPQPSPQPQTGTGSGSLEIPLAIAALAFAAIAAYLWGRQKK